MVTSPCSKMSSDYSVDVRSAWGAGGVFSLARGVGPSAPPLQSLLQPTLSSSTYLTTTTFRHQSFEKPVLARAFPREIMTTLEKQFLAVAEVAKPRFENAPADQKPGTDEALEVRASYLFQDIQFRLSTTNNSAFSAVVCSFQDR